MIKGHTLYQLSIEALRYALGRNNHLEPSGTFTNLREVIPQIEDETFRLATAKQCLDETLDSIQSLSDTNKREAYNFLQWLNCFIRDNQ